MCVALYVGQTRRDIHTRISEHRNFVLNWNKLTMICLNITFFYYDFTILTSGKSKLHLEMRESPLISKLKLILNNNIFSMPLKC